MHNAPSIHLQECRYIFARADRGTSDVAKLRDDGIARHDRRWRTPVDLANLLNQAGIIVGDSDDIAAASGRSRTPR
jgi:hypothetical protein